MQGKGAGEGEVGGWDGVVGGSSQRHALSVLSFSF